ncbi:MAG: outer membrane lipoprotein carrier protein LolA [Paracoccaceae bacterium]|nr:outer membrane lipoprotein carrier protein LolA [Paracoccaceae bacterium]MCY4101393.1 outer membrane lipoprotein carrier protein LolA [Paracoccaceae bacterium]MDE2675761.1 outer membrane lipoprotein carrier protein LolA [Paracoccaceae bacterium]
MPLNKTCKQIGCLLIGFLALSIHLPAETEDKPTLQDLETYLEEIDTLYSEILQINYDGSRSEGKLYLDRPLRARLEYSPPDTGILIAHSGSVAVFDKNSNTGPTFYPLRHTPFFHLLKRNLDFTDSDIVLDHLIGTEYNELHLKITSQHLKGRLELVFQNDPLLLVGWVFVDEFENRTMVQLLDIKSNIKIDPRFFNIELQKDLLNLD